MAVETNHSWKAATVGNAEGGGKAVNTVSWTIVPSMLSVRVMIRVFWSRGGRELRTDSGASAVVLAESTPRLDDVFDLRADAGFLILREHVPAIGQSDALGH